jgi:Rad3-related DNA helicase
MEKKLGLSTVEKDRVETLMLGSPFNYEKQLKVITPTFLASPKMSAIYEKDVENIIITLSQHFDHGTLGLFTSYKMMKSIYYNVADSFKKRERVILMQGKDSTRSDLVKNFKEVRNSFLFGTDSFWEGVDVPGDALEALLIVKLPFSVPTEPVIEVRIEDIEKRGLNSFMHFSVPEAILKFKQGVGRLIRSAEDRGVVYILDSRVTNTRWGEAFVNSLPVPPIAPKSLKQLISLTEESFKDE